MNAGRNPILIGVLLVVIGILLLFIGARARHSGPGVRGLLEGQGSILVPAGVASLIYGATRTNGRKNGNGNGAAGDARTKMEEPNSGHGA